MCGAAGAKAGSANPHQARGRVAAVHGVKLRDGAVTARWTHAELQRGSGWGARPPVALELQS